MVPLYSSIASLTVMLGQRRIRRARIARRKVGLRWEKNERAVGTVGGPFVVVNSLEPNVVWMLP